MLRRTLVLVVVAACGGGDEPELHELVVAPHKQPCNALGPRLCNTVSVDGGSQATFHDAIEGFTFRWGVESTLQVRFEAIPNPPADGSDTRYILEDVLDEREEGAPFELEFFAIVQGLDPDRERWFAPVSSGVVELVFDTRVACTDPLCTELADIGEAPATVGFELTGDPITPVRATAVR